MWWNSTTDTQSGRPVKPWESHAVGSMHTVKGNHLIDSLRMKSSHKRYARYSNSIPDDMARNGLHTPYRMKGSRSIENE